MNVEKIIKAQSREAMNGKWISLVAGFLLLSAMICLVVTGVDLAVSVFGIRNENGMLKPNTENIFTVIVCTGVLVFMLLTPAKNGFLKICYNIASGKEGELKDAFYFFKRNKFLSALQFNLLLTVRFIVNILIGLIPFFILWAVTYFFSLQLLTTVTANEIAYYIQLVFFITGIVFGIIRSAKLYIADFLFIENDGETENTISASKAILKKHGKDAFRLFISFIPWIALCFFVLPAIYVIPYMSTSFATSSKWLIRLYKDGKIV